jgi:hypothetical protein
MQGGCELLAGSEFVASVRLGPEVLSEIIVMFSLVAD